MLNKHYREDFFMKDRQREDTHTISRGIFFGILFGSILWMLVMGIVVYCIK